MVVVNLYLLLIIIVIHAVNIKIEFDYGLFAVQQLNPVLFAEISSINIMDYNMTNTTIIDTNDKSDGLLIVILIFSGLLLFLRCCVIGPICDNINKTDNGGINKLECYICMKIFNYFCPTTPQRVYTDTDSDSEYDDEDYYYVKDKTNIYEQFINNNPRSDNPKMTQKYNNQCTICLEPLIDSINDDSVVINMPSDIPEDMDTDYTEETENNKIAKDIVLDLINSLDLETDHIILLKCGHSFHYNCIRNWDKELCPNCKATIEIDSWY